MPISREGEDFENMDVFERIEVDKDTVDNLVQTIVARKDLSGVHSDKAQDMIEILVAHKLSLMSQKKSLIDEINELTSDE